MFYFHLASNQADPQSQKAFADTLSETLASLSQNAESLQQASAPSYPYQFLDQKHWRFRIPEL